MKRPYLPDVNTWLALSFGNHVHSKPAGEWYRSLGDSEALCFCRQVQISFLRLVTTTTVMGEKTQTLRGAWRIYERWCDEESAEFLDEPTGMEAIFKARTDSNQVSPKVWNDAYLAAFAEAAGLTLVTFDRALAGKTKGAVLLS